MRRTIGLILCVLAAIMLFNGCAGNRDGKTMKTNVLLLPHFEVDSIIIDHLLERGK